jgi:hypothetical protein
VQIAGCGEDPAPRDRVRADTGLAGLDAGPRVVGRLFAGTYELRARFASGRPPLDRRPATSCASGYVAADGSGSQEYEHPRQPMRSGQQWSEQTIRTRLGEEQNGHSRRGPQAPAVPPPASARGALRPPLLLRAMSPPK